MNILIELIVDMFLLGIYAIIGLVVALLIQGIVLWLTGFNIAKFLYKKFILDELKKGW